MYTSFISLRETVRNEQKILKLFSLESSKLIIMVFRVHCDRFRIKRICVRVRYSTLNLYHNDTNLTKVQHRMAYLALQTFIFILTFTTLRRCTNHRIGEREREKKIVPDVALESNVKGQCWGDLERHSSLVFLGCYVRTRFFRLLPSWGQFPYE